MTSEKLGGRYQIGQGILHNTHHPVLHHMMCFVQWAYIINFFIDALHHSKKGKPIVHDNHPHTFTVENTRNALKSIGFSKINVCFWETAHLPLPKPNINTSFLLWEKC